MIEQDETQEGSNRWRIHRSRNHSQIADIPIAILYRVFTFEVHIRAMWQTRAANLSGKYRELGARARTDRSRCPMAVRKMGEERQAAPSGRWTGSLEARRLTRRDHGNTGWPDERKRRGVARLAPSQLCANHRAVRNVVGTVADVYSSGGVWWCNGSLRAQAVHVYTRESDWVRPGDKFRKRIIWGLRTRRGNSVAGILESSSFRVVRNENWSLSW